MNATENTNRVAPTEDIKKTALRPMDTLPTSAQRTQRGTQLHYASLLGIALLSAGLVIAVLYSINQLNTEIERIYAVVTLPVR